MKQMKEERWVHPKGKNLTAGGAEIPDPVPTAPPVGYERPVSFFDQVRDMIRSDALRRAAAQVGAETEEEADDFDVGDDYDPTSPYEYDFDPAVRAEAKPEPGAVDAGAGDRPADPGAGTVREKSATKKESAKKISNAREALEVLNRALADEVED